MQTELSCLIKALNQNQLVNIPYMECKLVISASDITKKNISYPPPIRDKTNTNHQFTIHLHEHDRLQRKLE